MRHTKILTLILLAFACGTGPGKESNGEISKTPDNSTSELVPKMEIKVLPATQIIYMTNKGSFNQHPEVIFTFSGYIESLDWDVKNYIGIYPEDPDAVSNEELDWELGFEVPDDVNVDELERFKVKTLEGTTALVVNSSVKNSPIHGLYCKVWLLEHGYVQTQPTRMIYHMDNEQPELQSTTIIFPVVKRTRDIQVITTSTLNHQLK
ncbi:GyrI-like domain-containing protein [Ekhidna sp.]|uniref:GyrI-like domain-containing protein n=1 Tax=Ekhidna sp. TaxID=2608089 RepID=UPI003CCBB7EE